MMKGQEGSLSTCWECALCLSFLGAEMGGRGLTQLSSSWHTAIRRQGCFSLSALGCELTWQETLQSSVSDCSCGAVLKITELPAGLRAGSQVCKTHGEIQWLLRTHTQVSAPLFCHCGTCYIQLFILLILFLYPSVSQLSSACPVSSCGTCLCCRSESPQCRMDFIESQSCLGWNDL